MWKVISAARREDGLVYVVAESDDGHRFSGFAKDGDFDAEKVAALQINDPDLVIAESIDAIPEIAVAAIAKQGLTEPAPVIKGASEKEIKAQLEPLLDAAVTADAISAVAVDAVKIGGEIVTTLNIAYGTYVAMTVTNLQSLANDATDVFAGWQSARVDNQTATKADDFEVQVLLSTAATSPANDQTVYVYLVPWMYDGSTWTPMANFGTTTRPTGSEATANMSDPNSMRGPIPLPYKITSQPIDGYFNVAALCGGIVPDGWSLAIRNCTGAALGTGCVVSYRPITYTNA